MITADARIARAHNAARERKAAAAEQGQIATMEVLRRAFLGLDVDPDDFLEWQIIVVGRRVEELEAGRSPVDVLGDLAFDSFLTGLYHERNE